MKLNSYEHGTDGDCFVCNTAKYLGEPVELADKLVLFGRVSDAGNLPMRQTQTET